MTTTRTAVIDMGTNTFHLLIAEVQPENRFHVLHEEKFSARIGHGGISKGILTEEACQRALTALLHFRKQIDSFKVPDEHIFAMATSAIRNATNGKKLVEAIFQQTRIQVKIISGEQEAEYIYNGVKAAVQIHDIPALIMDIGGGSVEFIICNKAGIFWKQSFEIGAQRLLDLFMQTDPIPTYAVQRIHDYLQDKLIPLTNAIHQYAPQELIGASGTFDTLCEIYYKKRQPDFDLAKHTEFKLPVAAYYEIHQDILLKNKEERLQMPGMAEIRADMIVVSCCLIDFVLKTYHLSAMRASTFALKEGVLQQLLVKG